MLKAPDLAIVQLVVELIGLVILLRATVDTRSPDVPFPRRPLSYAVALVFTGFLLTVFWAAVKQLPAFGKPLMTTAGPYINEGFSQTGAANIVSAVALGFRGYDTMAGIIALFTVAVAVSAILQVQKRKKP